MGIQDIKKRTKAVRNTLQITKAMELIASIKMRSAINAAENSRIFSQDARNLLQRLANQGKTFRHPLLNGDVETRPASTLLVVASSDKGLCGSFNSEIFRKALEFINQEKQANRSVDAIAIGQKANSFLNKISQVQLIANFPTLGENIDFEETLPVAKLVLDEFGSGKYQKVVLTYAKFISMMQQRPNLIQILPIEAKQPEEKEASVNKINLQYEYEPDPEEVLNTILPQLSQMIVYQALLENNASEHAARMVAMKNATDAGQEIVADLEFSYNRLRQEKITTELSEISSGAQAFS